MLVQRLGKSLRLNTMKAASIDMKMDQAEETSDEELVLQGQVLEALEQKQGIWQSMKFHKAAVAYSLAGYTCAATYGYDAIANGATLALPSFELYFGKSNPTTHVLYLPSLWTSLWSSMSGLGQIAGSCIAGPVSNAIGRRYTIMAFSLVSILGVALQYIATNQGLLLAGKAINGLAVGGFLAVGTTYASEVAPTRLRPLLLGGLGFTVVTTQCIGLGIIRAFISVKTPSGFRIPFACQWIVGILPAIAFLIVPESPTWHLLKNNKPLAHASLTRLYGHSSSIPARLSYLQKTILHSKTLASSSPTPITYLSCFRGSDLKRTLTILLLMLSNGLIGTSFLSQNIYFLTLVGLPIASSFDINIGGFALAIFLMPLTWLYINKVGRRRLYLIGITGDVIALTIIGSLGFASSENKAALWMIAILLNLLITWQQFTSTLTTYSLTPELSTPSLRQHTQSLSITTQALTGWIFSFLTPYLYNIDSSSLHLGAKTGFIFAATSLGTLVWAFWWVPEIEGLSAEELDGLYREGVSPRLFSRFVVGERQRGGGEVRGEVGLESWGSAGKRGGCEERIEEKIEG